MNTSEASFGSNTPAAGNGTRRWRKELLAFKLPERRDQDPDLKTSSDFLTHLGKKIAGMKIGDHQVMSHKCVRDGQLSQEEVGRCVHHNQARKMSEDVFSGGDWETGLAKDDDVKRKAPSPQVHQTPDFSEKLSWLLAYKSTQSLSRVTGHRHSQTAKCSLALGKLECNLLCQAMYTNVHFHSVCQVLARTAH